MTNIIQFPLHKVKKQIDIDEDEYNEIGDEVMVSMLTTMYECGYEIDFDEFQKEFCFLYEAIISLLYKVNGKEHTMQYFADAYIEFSDDIDEEEQLEFDFD
jgi:hypothetical protein